jgi:hypothetical protein
VRHLAALIPILVATAPAQAHEGDHSCMPHMVTAGVGVAAQDLRGALDQGLFPAVGLAASHALAPVPELELRLRFQYDKALPGDELLRDRLHELRVLAGPSVITVLVPDRLDLVVGFEAGWAAHLLEDARAHGWSLGASVGLRGWVTWHTGFWGELRTSYVETDGDDLVLVARRPVELMVGWADRF